MPMQLNMKSAPGQTHMPHMQTPHGQPMGHAFAMGPYATVPFTAGAPAGYQAAFQPPELNVKDWYQYFPAVAPHHPNADPNGLLVDNSTATKIHAF